MATFTLLSKSNQPSSLSSYALDSVRISLVEFLVEVKNASSLNVASKVNKVALLNIVAIISAFPTLPVTPPARFETLFRCVGSYVVGLKRFRDCLLDVFPLSRKNCFDYPVVSLSLQYKPRVKYTAYTQIYTKEQYKVLVYCIYLRDLCICLLPSHLHAPHLTYLTSLNVLGQQYFDGLPAGH